MYNEFSDAYSMLSRRSISCCFSASDKLLPPDCAKMSPFSADETNGLLTASSRAAELLLLSYSHTNKRTSNYPAVLSSNEVDLLRYST